MTEQPTQALTEDSLLDILYKHIELDYLHASDGHPDIVGFSKAVAAILAAYENDRTYKETNE